MSRTLSKILVICALVVVVPLMVVGTTLAAYFSIDSSITIAAVVDHNVAGASAKFSYDGEEYTSHEITTGQTKTVEVSATYTKEAYILKGWFKGDAQAYSKAKENGTETFVSTEETLSINMEENSDYVVVYEAVRYSIADWEYRKNPTEDTITHDLPTGAKREYFYGEDLPKLEYQGEEYIYEGWKIKGDTTQTRHTNTKTIPVEYTTATPIESRKEIVLTDPWNDAVTIKYIGLDGHTEITTEKVGKNGETAYTLKTPDQIAASQLVAGYTYYWSDTYQGTNRLSTVTPNENKTVYLTRDANPITYTINAGGAYTGEAVTFTVDNADALASLFEKGNWTTEHKFWEVENVKIVYGEGDPYQDAESLKDAIVKANPHSAATISVALSEDSIHKYFTTIAITTIEVKASDVDYLPAPVFDQDVYHYVANIQSKIVIRGLSDNRTTATIKEAFYLNDYENWTTQEGAKVEFQGLSITGGYLLEDFYDFTEMGLTIDSTLLEVLDKLAEKNPSLLIGMQDTLQLDKVTIGFTYEAQ